MFPLIVSVLQSLLKREHFILLITLGWVTYMTVHSLWVCGLLTFIGLQSPFVRAAEVEKVQAEVVKMQSDVRSLMRSSEITARIQMETDLRVQIRTWCNSDVYEERVTAYRRIIELRRDLLEIANTETPTPTCDRSKP